MEVGRIWEMRGETMIRIYCIRFFFKFKIQNNLRKGNWVWLDGSGNQRHSHWRPVVIFKSAISWPHRRWNVFYLLRWPCLRFLRPIKLPLREGQRSRFPPFSTWIWWVGGGPNSKCQAWQQVLSPAEPSCWPFLFLTLFFFLNSAY